MYGFLQPLEGSRSHAVSGGTKSDIWNVGILVLQMANGFKRDRDDTPLSPLSSSSYGQSRTSSPQKRSAPPTWSDTDAVGLPTLPPTASKPLRMLVRACLQRNARKRATVEQLIKMSFFQVDTATATNEMLRTVCTDLDASMRRLISSSITASAHSPSKMHRSVSRSPRGSPVVRTVPARSGSTFASSPVYAAAHARARASSTAAPAPTAKNSRY